MLMNNFLQDYTMPRPPPHHAPTHQVFQPNNLGAKTGAHSKLGHSSNLNNHSVLGYNSTMNFYPHLVQPTRLSDILGAESSNGSSNRSPSTRNSHKFSATQAVAKNVSFYRSGDVHMQAFKVAISRRHFRTFDSLLEALSDRIPLPFGVRTVSTPSGIHGINRLEEFEDGKAYVCSDKKTVKPLNLNALQQTRPPWFISKPKTRTKAVAQLVRRPDADSLRVPLRLTKVKTPKKIFIVRNGEPTFRHSILLSRRTPQSFENILEDIGEMFRMRAQKLYTADGKKVESLQSLYLGPNLFVAAGREAFQPMEYRIKRVAITEEKRVDHQSTTDLQANLNKERTPKLVKKTQGRWRVTVITSELAAAGTDSRVTITVYGAKANTGPILLNDENNATFRSGNEDEFMINVGGIGDIRKVRIAHDNTGTSPGWLCESITLTDITTGQILEFPCNRWLSRDEDDGEICREIPARWPDRPNLTEATYIVTVTTGNLWNAGTNTNVYMTLFGEMGDCGPRLLQHGGKLQAQLKGTTDTYRFDSVSLGPLHKIVVGHENEDKGAGWFLERISVKEDRVGSEEWVFICDRWLDAGEDDGKTIRELYLDREIKTHSRSRSQFNKNKEDRMWELEKWKFQRGNHVVLINQATQKALRLRHDAGVDGLGEPSQPQCAFEVIRRRGNIRGFSNVSQPAFHIALDQNRILGQGKGGSYSEFQVKIFPDRSVALESVKYPGQHVTVDPGGKPADTRGHPGAPSRLFVAYVKGCFRHDSIILLNTSLTQALAITSHGDVIGTGHRADVVVDDVDGIPSEAEHQFSRLRVVKVAQGVRMFRCDRDPAKFLQMKDGHCDGWGNGDVYCHFKIHKYREGGYITLQSMKHRGVFIGLNANGKARPTVDTGDENTQFYPEVIKFGERRKEKAKAWKTPEPSFIVSSRDEMKPTSSQGMKSPSKSKLSTRKISLHERERSDTGPRDGDFRIYVTTGNSGMTQELVTLYVFGDKNNSMPISLGKGTLGGVFQCGQTDEFQANLTSVGEIKKIRIGVEEASPECEWRLKQVKMKDMASNEVFRFKFNRWISRKKDDGATLRELPVITQSGNPILPIFRYFIFVRTSKESTRLLPDKNSRLVTTQHEIYLCLHGKNGDSGRRLLVRKPAETTSESIEEDKPLFAPGRLDRFEMEAVSLGELTKCSLSCPKLARTPSIASQSWLCDEIIVRESEGSSEEYVFQCKKWLGGASKVGAKLQLKLDLTTKREVKRGKSGSSEHKEGDWKLSVTTGSVDDSGTSSNVMFQACDVDGTSSGTIFLGSGSKGLFDVATTERFKVNLLGLKDLYKIRLSIDGAGNSPSWYVERIKLQCVGTSVTHLLDVCKTLALNEEPYQPFIEIPIPKPGRESPTVLRYQVIVYTGNILGSDTDANVFISLFGENGDTGRRPLHKSLNNILKFQESQIDIFELEAVDLGELTKIEIGHDGVGHGNGWFLHKVIVKETLISPRDFVFFCNRWLDDGQEDGKIERTILVELLDEDEIVEKHSDGKYTVLVTTGDQSGDQACPDDANVMMVIYGEDGKTGQILLKADQSEGNNKDTTNSFKPGRTDQFQIEVPEIGNIYKIRLSYDEQSNWLGWFVEKVVLEDMSTGQHLIFNCNRWLSTVEDDQQTVREFAAVTNGQESLPVHPYCITVTTGDRVGASTDANVYLTLRGERGDTGRRKLAHYNTFPFQRAQTSSFTIEAVDLGKLNEIVVSHDGRGYGAGWFLEKIIVKESEFSMIESLFPGHMWLDDHVGDCKTTRRLKLLGNCDATAGEEELLPLTSPPSREVTTIASGNLFDVTVLVDEVISQGNEAVLLNGVVYGNKRASEPISLGKWKPGQGKEFSNRVNLGEIGEINKIRVEAGDSPRDLNLYLLSVQLQNVHTKELLLFNFQRRFRTESGSTTKELPAPKSSKPLSNLIRYLVSVDMIPLKSEVTCDGRLQIRLVGSNGDSGFRTLFRGLDGLNATKQTNGYVFELEAVDLGELTSLFIAYVTDDVAYDDGGWNISEVYVRMPELPNVYAGKSFLDPTYHALVDRTFKADYVEADFQLEACEPEVKVEEVFRGMSANKPRKRVKSAEIMSEGVWRLSLTAVAFNESSSSNQIPITILGTRGSFDVINTTWSQVKPDDVTRSEEIKSFYVDCKLEMTLGELYEIRLTLNEESPVRIHKVKLKDLTTSQEYLAHISAKERLSKRAENGFFTYNIPLVKPDQDQTSIQKYQVQIKTGDVLAAESDADININISGTRGETGLRSLAELVSDRESLFNAGTIDSFLMETIDIGEPRKVTISHSATGEGSGWFLEEVIITDTRDDLQTDYIFPCNKWLDDSVDDQRTQRELYLMGTRLYQPNVDVTQSKGKWKCEVYAKSDVITQAGIDVRFTLCLSGGISRDIVRHVDKPFTEFNIELDKHAAALTEHQAMTSNLVKLRACLESTNESSKKYWPLEEFCMNDEDTGEIIRFVFDSELAWEGSHRGYLRELPAVRFNDPYIPVTDYYIIIYTSDQSHYDFLPSLVSCQLHGTHGSTGWRDLASAENVDGKFQPSRVDVFTIEAVNLGDVIDCISLRVVGPLSQAWNLDRVKIKRGYYDSEEQVFEYDREITDNEEVKLYQSKIVPYYPRKALATSRTSANETATNQIRFEVEILWNGLDTFLDTYLSSDASRKNNSTLSAVLQLGGDKGISDMTSVSFSDAVRSSNGRHASKLMVITSYSTFGELTNIGFGILDPALSHRSGNSDLILYKLSVRNQDTQQYYSFRPKHSFTDILTSTANKYLTGLNWINLVAARPRQDPTTLAKVCTYLITVSTSDHKDAGTNANAYITLVGANEESGKRWLMTTSSGNDVTHHSGGEMEFCISGLYLGDLRQIIIGHDGRDVTSGWHLDQVTVTSSLVQNKQFVFVCRKWLANLQEDTFIERTLNLHHIIDVDSDVTSR